MISWDMREKSFLKKKILTRVKWHYLSFSNKVKEGWYVKTVENYVYTDLGLNALRLDDDTLYCIANCVGDEQNG